MSRTADGRWRAAWAALAAPAAGSETGLPRDAGMPPVLEGFALAAKGFLSADEGRELFRLAAEASRIAPCLEVGSYCGRSTLFLAAGCRAAGAHPLLAVDHHRGSAEQQPGEEYFDPDLLDPEELRVDTFRTLRRNVEAAGLAEWVIPIVAESECLSRLWPETLLGLVFLDGGHGEADVRADFAGWAPRVAAGGYLCMHDIYADPLDGGQAPYRVFEEARSSAGWSFVTQVDSLGVLRRR